MTVRPDNRLLDAPMVPVTCRTCDAAVQVRKSTWAQTSVQWDAEAMARCIQRRHARRLAGPVPGVFLFCSELRESIEDSVCRGAVPLVEEAVEI